MYFQVKNTFFFLSTPKIFCTSTITIHPDDGKSPLLLLENIHQIKPRQHFTSLEKQFHLNLNKKVFLIDWWNMDTDTSAN